MSDYSNSLIFYEPVLFFSFLFILFMLFYLLVQLVIFLFYFMLDIVFAERFVEVIWGLG